MSTSEPASFTEFRLKAWRRPIRFGILLLNASLFGAIGSGCAHLLFRLAALPSLLTGAPLAFGIALLILRKDNRALPQGHLHLSPSKLSYASGLGPIVELPASEVRDVVADRLAQALVIRRKSGPRIAIPLARLEVPEQVFTRALTAWISDAGSALSSAFAAETARAEKRRKTWQAVLAWGSVVAVVIAVIRILAVLLAK